MWRAIVIFLTVLLTVSAFAGVVLGQALTESAPFRTDTLQEANRHSTAITTAGIPEAPQPRVDGTLGLPVRAVASYVADATLISAMENTASSVSMSKIVANPAPSRDPALILAGLDTGAPPRTTDEAGMVIPGLNHHDPRLANAVAAPATAPTPTGPSWLQQLRTGLTACLAQQRHNQPECEQRQRQQFCTPNDAWGRVAECPAFLQNLRF